METIFERHIVRDDPEIDENTVSVDVNTSNNGLWISINDYETAAMWEESSVALSVAMAKEVLKALQEAIDFIETQEKNKK